MECLNNNLEEDTKKGLAVIGVGLPRTGTMSTAKALAYLLECPPQAIYHGMQITTHSQEQLEFWPRAYNGQIENDAEWVEFFQHYRACLDIPAILFYKDLLRVFPKAKVLLTIRSPESWFKSWHSSIAVSLEVVEKMPYKWLVKHDQKVWRVHHGARHFKPSWCDCTLSEAFASVSNATEFYNKWVADVIASVPSDRLLVFSVSDCDWRPLCNFLDKPLPPADVPFPVSNESQSMRKRIQAVKRRCWIKIAIAVLSFTAILSSATITVFNYM